MLLAHRKPASDNSTASTRPSPCRRRRCASNEITNITTNTGSSWIIPAHDAAGNMTSAPSANDPTKRHWYVYDAWNRLVAVWEDDGDATKEITGGSPDDTLIARYEYDGQNRRIAKEVYAGGSLDHTLDMYYNENWQILEVRKDGNANPLKQYVWHTYYIDAPAIRYYDDDTDGSSIATQYFTHDANFNVTALTDDTGAVIERYDYTPYGQVTILDPDFSDDADGVSDYEQDVLFAGYQYDAESGMYHVRHRNHHPMLGRWVQRDPLDYIDGANVYEYVRSSPTFTTDPTGRSCADVRANCLTNCLRQRRPNVNCGTLCGRIYLNCVTRNSIVDSDVASTVVTEVARDVAEKGVESEAGSAIGSKIVSGASNLASSTVGQTIDGIKGFGNSSACAAWYRRTQSALVKAARGCCEECKYIWTPNKGDYAKCVDDLVDSGSSVGVLRFEKLAIELQAECQNACN